MKRNEIMELIDTNNAIIADAKEHIKMLTKIKQLIEDYESTKCSFIGGVEKIDDEIATFLADIEEAKARNAKRKKQLKLIDQIEALNDIA